MKAGSKVEYADLEVGMRIHTTVDPKAHAAECGVSAVEGQIWDIRDGADVRGYSQDCRAAWGKDDFLLGTEHDTFTLLEDFNEPKLPEREGLVVASWAAKPSGLSTKAGANVLGRWRRVNGKWMFVPFGAAYGVHASRITAITEVSPTPDDALELLARLQRESDCSEGVLDVLKAFFRRVNEVSS